MEGTDWEDYKEEIKRLYIRQGKTLPEVMEILRKRRNFNKSKKQYETAFAKWGVRKYKLTPKKWKIINRKIQKRKQKLGKESEVYVDGVQYPPAKVQTGILKYGFMTAAEMHSVPSPEMPDGITVCSPIPVARFQWPYSLPWLQFLQQVNGQESQISPIILSSGIRPIDLHEHPLVTLDMVQNLESFLPEQDPRKKSTMGNDSYPDEALDVLMPEEHDEEHRLTSQVLRGPRNNMGLPERFKLLFYLLSNNFRLVERSEIGRINEELFGWTGVADDMRDRKKEDELILNIFRSSGFNTTENMKHLLAMSGLTPAVIAEKLFGSATRLVDLETVALMLDAGLDPQTLIMTYDFRSITPLEYFCKEYVSVDMVKLLLSHNADVNKYENLPILVFAIFSRNQELVNILVSNGADIRVCLEALKSIAEEEYLGEEVLDFLRPFFDSYFSPNIKEHGAILTLMLRLSVLSCSVEWVNLLLERGADVDSLHDVEFDSSSCHTTALGLAAERDATDLIQALHIRNASLNPRCGSTDIVHPLTLAVADNSLDATALLISYGGDINTSDHFGTRRKTLFDRALEKKRIKICEYLLSEGAVVEENTLQAFYWEKLRLCVLENDVDSILQLPLHQIDMGHAYGDHQITVLGQAIELGRHSIVTMLTLSGANDPGKRICRIGGLEMAKYLNSIGLLPRVLSASGQVILANAINADEDALVEYLLHSNTGEMGGSKATCQCQRNPVGAAITRNKLHILHTLLAHGISVTDEDLTESVRGDLKSNDNSFLKRIVDLRSLMGFNAPKALGLAAERQSSLLVNTLLDSGIDPRAQKPSRRSRSALEISVEGDNDDIFQRIFTSAEWSKEMLGRSFTESVWYKKWDRMQFLHDAGADLNQGIPRDTDFWFPLQIAVQTKNITLVKTLIEYGCDPNKSEKFTEERTPLQSAAWNGNIEILELLLEAGADLDGRPVIDGTTALQFAVKKGNMVVIEKLLNAGADVNSAPAPHNGATALQFAARQGFIGIVRRLLEAGADVNAGRAPRGGRTALEGAAEYGRLEILELLLDRGAFIHGKGRRQYIRAVKLAEWNGHSSIAKFLRSCGQWTALDTKRADLETNSGDSDSEPDYENDLAWDHEIPWELMLKITQRSGWRSIIYPDP
ncbi:hypothetical protein FQN54_004613 [Arachnomyces sp. PD_36]|nr:hypothetical protein FQN54_004613 [Arachnomyces sp. PD_36]